MLLDRLGPPHHARARLNESRNAVTKHTCRGLPCIELAKVSRALDTVKASGILDKLEPGHRYFFGHRIP